MILVSTQTFPPRLGGIENLMYSLCKSLFDSGEWVNVYADQHDYINDELIDIKSGFSIFRYAGIKPIRRLKKARDLSKAASNNTKLSPRLITDSWKSLEHIDEMPFSRILCLAHGSEVTGNIGFLKRRRIRNAFTKADYIVANSCYTASLVEPYVKNTSKIKVIYPGIDIPDKHTTDQTITNELKPYGPILITVARLDKRKGQHHIIRLLPILLSHFPSLLYVIIGDGAERSNLENMVNELGVNNNVVFKGSLSGDTKNAYLALSDLFVMPGSAIGRNIEGFGMAYIEAAYFGLPSVACSVGGAIEAVLDNQTGLVSAPGDMAQLEVNVLRMLNEKELYTKLAQQAQERAKSFLWPVKIIEYKQLLTG